MRKSIYKTVFVLILFIMCLSLSFGSANAYYGLYGGVYGSYGGLYGGLYGSYGGLYGGYGGLYGMYGGSYGMYGGLYGMYGGAYGLYGLNAAFNMYNLYYPVDAGLVTYQVPFLQIAPLLGMAGLYRSLFPGLYSEGGVIIDRSN